MARPPRIHVAGGFYHVTTRGNHQEPLFATAADRQTLNELVAEAVARYGIRIHGFCWMTNHLHLLIQAGATPLGRSIQHIKMHYARHRHRSMRTTGHLFEKRYGAAVVATDRYFLAALRYIHLNPVKAGMVRDAAEYRWSSHRTFMRLAQVPWLTTEFTFSLLANTPDAALPQYRNLMQQADAELDDELLRQPARAVTPFSEAERTRFPCIAEVPASKPLCGGQALTDLAEEVCARHSIDPHVLNSPSRERFLYQARREFARLAVDGGLATPRQVAEFLDRDTSALYRLMRRR